MEEVILVNDISKHFNKFVAVDSLSFTVNKGDVFGFLGPNGAGKSTTMRMMLGLIYPTYGSIKILGQEMPSKRTSVLGKIGAIIEKPDFYKTFSAAKNIEIFARLSGVHISKKQIYEMLDFVGLHGRYEDKVKSFSHGMKQRLGIAQALIHDPEIIVLDEPTTGLDPQGIIDIRNLINHLAQEKGKTVLLSSHLLSEIELTATRMIIINNGKKILEGDVKELLTNSVYSVKMEIDSMELAQSTWSNSAGQLPALSIAENVISFSAEKNQVAAINKLMNEAGVNVYSITYQRPLEELFLRITKN
ncbi:MAG: ABC transporter ATP-binding protein [Bacteroidetes bacterium]|nr:ABC transporter ATP-binding protein [Bacteroidota bacterium]